MPFHAVSSRLAVLDPVLGPTYTRHAATPSAAVLAVLAASASADIKPSVARRWLTSRGSEDVKSLVSSGAWPRLVRTSATFIEASRSDAGRRAARISVARRLVGHVVSPASAVAVSVRAQPGARAAAALAGVVALRNLSESGSGIDAPLLSYAWVGVSQGLAVLAAGQRLRLASDAGWVRQVGTRKGSAQAWKLRQLGPTAREVTWDFSATIDALADGDLTDPLASVLLSVDSPVWGYHHTLDHRSWLVLVADSADIDAGETYGLSERTIRSHRLALSRAGLVAGADLAARLDTMAREDGLAGEPSPLDRWTVAEDARRAAAAERKAQVLVVRAERDAARAVAQAEKDARPSKAKGKAPGAAPVVQERRIPLPAGFDPKVHGAALKRKLQAQGLAVRGVVLAPRDGSPAYAVIEPAVAAA